MTSAIEALPPSHRLLLAAVSTSEVDADRLTPVLAGGGVRWQELARLAKANRVTSFVHRLLGHGPIAPLVGASVREDWRQLHEQELARVEKKVGQLREIGEILAGAGVEALVYKGPDFNQRFYRRQCPRAFNDLDIVLWRRDVPAAVAALEAAGYRAPPDIPPLRYFLRFHLHAIYLHPGGGHPVEVHWALDSPYADLPDLVPPLFAAAEPGTVFGPSLLRPAAADALALMVLHLEKHAGLCASLPDPARRLKALIAEGGLSWVLDVVLWLRHAGASMRPEALLERVRELAAERALVIGLRLACDVDARAVPPWAADLAALLPHRPPLLARMLYPAAAGSFRSALRRALRITLPVVAFRPSRVLEALLPRFEVPGIERPRRARGPVRSFVWRLGFVAANLAALLAWRLGSWVSRAAALSKTAL